MHLWPRKARHSYLCECMCMWVYEVFTLCAHTFCLFTQCVWKGGYRWHLPLWVLVSLINLLSAQRLFGCWSVDGCTKQVNTCTEHQKTQRYCSAVTLQLKDVAATGMRFKVEHVTSWCVAWNHAWSALDVAHVDTFGANLSSVFSTNYLPTVLHITNIGFYWFHIRISKSAATIFSFLVAN